VGCVCRGVVFGVYWLVGVRAVVCFLCFVVCWVLLGFWGVGLVVLFFCLFFVVCFVLCFFFFFVLLCNSRSRDRSGSGEDRGAGGGGGACGPVCGALGAGPRSPPSITRLAENH